MSPVHNPHSSLVFTKFLASLCQLDTVFVRIFFSTAQLGKSLLNHLFNNFRGLQFESEAWGWRQSDVNIHKSYIKFLFLKTYRCQMQAIGLLLLFRSWYLILKKYIPHVLMHLVIRMLNKLNTSKRNSHSRNDILNLHVVFNSNWSSAESLPKYKIQTVL